MAAAAASAASAASAAAVAKDATGRVVGIKEVQCRSVRLAAFDSQTNQGGGILAIVRGRGG
jgi:hypothetical protein